ncbi:Oidioi.mRNA.OKI2018_I69.chr2.g4439.t2.cds [Oikopleura dioica]|uniref:Oidioi.mRNA.OKI2018_I69.chr2.g4439.t2.cds n=1 Tax=Oikopleura dioica TaxID=34765 RepID=A0ABN7T164_OIKDI|nr:Oidioi.mRNA.OKI2018_I69.chr2.g4439.t2.cds [Oikopleura dioica]
MILIFLLPLFQAEIICEYDEPCLRACTDSVCEYFWNIEHRYSQTWRTSDFGEKRSYPKGAMRDFPLSWNSTKKNFDIFQEGINVGINDVIDENGRAKNPLDELEKLLLLDGQQMRKVITINGQVPGPNIVVNKGALVKITVKSTLHEESCKSFDSLHYLTFPAVSLHWHGLHQYDNYWNDGAAMFSQCPVDAFNSFTYVMKAENAGTHWYHSHYIIQRADGLHGAFIILDKGSLLNKQSLRLPLWS